MKTKQLTLRSEVQQQALLLCLTCGSPFILVIGFTALTAFLTEKSFGEFIQEVAWPAEILAIIAAVSLLLSAWLSFNRNSRLELANFPTEPSNY